MKMETRKSDRIVIRLRAHFHAFMEDFRVGNCAVIRRREREREREKRNTQNNPKHGVLQLYNTQFTEEIDCKL